MKPLAVLLSAGAIGLLWFLIARAGNAEWSRAPAPAIQGLPEIERAASEVNSWLRTEWAKQNLEPAEPADELTVLRRLSLALHGTVPSLEEVVAFREDKGSDRLERWTARLLEDRRFPDYFAERLSRVLAGVEEGPFLVFRRDRFRDWIADQLRNDRPWNEMTTDLIAAEGLWTSTPASNFVTAAFIPDERVDVNKLTGRTVRAFLGQRIDCAQCHNHPFDSWKQTDFEGLAAFYGQAQLTPGGVIDRLKENGQPVEYRIAEPGSDKERIVQPVVPFHSEWMQTQGTRRQQLASWVVHPDNRRFERAAVNRIWGLMFGKSWHDPVDDLPHPDDDPEHRDLLDVAGELFRQNGYHLKFLIQLIARSDAFRLKSEVSWADEDVYTEMQKNWAVFPLVRLRPEQMIGSMFQAARVRTIDQNSNLFVRFGRFTNENDFLKEYGDADDDELLQQSGTIPQALLRMNGRFTRELTKTELFSSAGQIMRHSDDDLTVIQNCFLACLTRLPDAEERDFFLAQLSGTRRERDGGGKGRIEQSPAEVTLDTVEADSSETGPSDDDSVGAHDSSPNDGAPTSAVESVSRQEAVRDLFWILFNSPGFSWNR